MNLTLINKFEAEFGETLRDISFQKFIDIFSEKELGSKYFTSSKNVKDILEFLKQNSNLNEFTSIAEIKFNLESTEKYIDELFSKYIEDKDRKSLIDSIKLMISSDDEYRSVSAVLCTLVALSDQNIEIYYDNVSESLFKLFSKIEKLPINKFYYRTHCDILDLIIQVKYYWESVYNSKFSISNLDDHLYNLHEFEFKEFDGGEYKSIDIAPEELGYIDITKLTNKDDNITK